MKLFAGLSRTDYQDILRAIGAMLDERELRDVRMWEHPDGLFVQGRKEGAPEFETLEFTDDDLQEILAASYRRRGQSTPIPEPAQTEPLGELPTMEHLMAEQPAIEQRSETAWASSRAGYQAARRMNQVPPDDN